ncbi:MAG TPA: four helix bundle protein [Microscillaceae bacterium]|nr:four helix bundle protein [Microscillaceae bacterium]
MEENLIKEKSFDFAIRIINLSKFLKEHHKEFDLSRQLIRSGTSIGALYREAQYAESKADFIHKLAIAQKECNETIYWLDLLQATNYLDEGQHNSIHNDAVSLLKIITSILKTSKKNNQ